VALLALFRPRRNLAVVASLWLWSEAISAAASSDRKKQRRVPPAWWLLLLGAAAAVLAGTRPVYRSEKPIRHATIAVHPCAELGVDGIVEMRQAAAGLLDRLDSEDRVGLRTAEILGQRADWSSPAQLRDALSGLTHLPVSAKRLDLAEGPAPADRTYHLAPAGCDFASGPDVMRIDISTHLPPVTIDALGAERIAPDKLQVFVALRNHTDQPVSASLSAGDALGSTASELTVTVEPESRKSVMMTILPADAIAVSAGVGESRSVGYLSRIKTSVRSVAIIGSDDPYLRRLIEVDPTLKLVAAQEDADVIIANRIAAPTDKPALVIAPATPPAGWRRADEDLSAIMLSEADVAGDDPIMRGVDLKAAAIRRSGAWVRGEGLGGAVLIGYKSAAIAVRSAESTDPSAPQRVYLAFDLSENNCTLVRSDAYVVFLANIMRSLAPGSPAPERYQYVTPLQAGFNPAWKRIVGDDSFDKSPLDTAGLTAPGVYRDPAGRLCAVSLPGLRSAMAQTPPEDVVAAIELPNPRLATQGRELWSILLVAAGLFWLSGWATGLLRD